MSMFRKRPGHTVRPIQPVRPSGILCAVGFLVAGAAVYWGPHVTAGRNPATSSHTATARVVHAAVAELDGVGQEPSAAEATPDQGPAIRPAEAGQPNACPWNPREIENRIASEANVRQTIERLKRDRRASCRQSSRRRHESGGCRSETESSREGRGNHAAGWTVDFHLLQRIAARRLGTAGQRPGRVLCRAVSDRMATTRDASPCRGASCLGACRARVRDARGRMDSFFEQHLRQRADAGPEADEGDLAAESIARPAAVAAASKPAVSDNPAPLELATRLTELRRRHAELLIDRTPLHPEVQNVATKIAALEEQLATLAKSVPIGAGEDPRHAGPPAAADPSQVAQSQAGQTPPGPNIEPSAAAVEELRRLKDAADRAGQALPTCRCRRASGVDVAAATAPNRNRAGAADRRARG